MNNLLNFAAVCIIIAAFIERIEMGAANTSLTLAATFSMLFLMFSVGGFFYSSKKNARRN